MSARFTYAVCGWPGCEGFGARHGGGHIVICRPLGEISHTWKRCPFHLQVEFVRVRDEEWYGRSFTWDCGTTAVGGEGWRLPPNVSERAYRKIDRARRPEHYARYDKQRDPITGRFAAVAG
jgi:hypothetical protein